MELKELNKGVTTLDTSHTLRVPIASHISDQLTTSPEEFPQPHSDLKSH